MKTLFTNFHTVGLVLRPESDLKEIFDTLQSILKTHNITCLIEKKSAKLLGLKGESFKALRKKCDFFISLGGDGTLLYTCRSIYPKELPILGINAGNLGFLTMANKNELKWVFSEIAKQKCFIQDRILLRIDFYKNNKLIESNVAFNEVVFERNFDDTMVKIDAYCDKKLINSYNGDGVIVATPSGSTAYNLSANGAIIYPEAKAFILTPICPHSLTQRPLVLPSNLQISFISKSANITIDGQPFDNCSRYDKVKISMANKKAKMILHEDRDYFTILRQKLNWGNV